MLPCNMHCTPAAKFSHFHARTCICHYMYSKAELHFMTYPVMNELFAVYFMNHILAIPCYN